MKIREKSFDTVVLGATFLGAGAALANPESALIIERGYTVGAELLDSLRINRCDVSALKSEKGKAYAKSLADRNALGDKGEIYSAAALFTLCGMIRDSNTKALFATETTEIKGNGQGYDIGIFNSDGHQIIHAKKILDTTSMGVIHNRASDIDFQKYINIMVHGEGGVFSGQIIRDDFTRRSIVRFPVDRNADTMTARNSFYTCADEILNGMKIIAMADTFDYDMPKIRIEISKNYIWRPSCGCKDLLTAFDRGCNEGEEYV